MKKRKKITIADKALANAVKKDEISINDIPKDKKGNIIKILKTTSNTELDKASKNKYRFSKRKVKHKKNNENMKQDDFKNMISNIDEWEDKVKGGLARNKKPSDFDLDDLSRGAEIQMEHTDDPEEAIDIAMDHLEEFDDYYDDDIGLPSMERELSGDDDDDDEDDDKIIKKFDKFNEEFMPHYSYTESDWEKDNDEEDDNENDDDDIELDNDDNYNEYNEKKIYKTMENKFIKRFNIFNRLNEDESFEPKVYPKENKFKRVIEYTDEIEQSLIERHFNKIEGDNNENFIIFDLMDKTYKSVSEIPNDIRPCVTAEFDHMMNNL